MKAQKIARELLNNYYNYYCCVYFDFILEAVENALEDGINANNLDEIHNHIKQNYI